MNRIIIASGPVIVENDTVFLNKHGDTNFWKFCGGKVENFETDLIENARREVQEEMGIDIEIIDENPFIVFSKKETPHGSLDVILVHFLAKRLGEIKPGKDIQEWNWININKLPEDLGPNIKPTLQYFGYIK